MVRPLEGKACVFVSFKGAVSFLRKTLVADLAKVFLELIGIEQQTLCNPNVDAQVDTLAEVARLS